ncbi:hypothetical protein BE18_13530 [Sorangium cellulosum]|uniref:Uncharacterized protein n=1 Tax=Sorangium cellulosum TaxID=56 RepID=A0A150T0G4_SORCE|nr:hypothetical protein BE18_13530 [Sorangium cellulosum]
MPTLEHNALVEMFREDSELAPHWLATLFHVEVPPYASVGVSHVNQWLAAAHPGVDARMPGDGGPLGPKPSKG